MFDKFSVSLEGSGAKKVMTYDNKGSFGELALLYNMPRAATVQVNNIPVSTPLLPRGRNFDNKTRGH
jgi:CRP-like cAMP-binding protein